MAYASHQRHIFIQRIRICKFILEHLPAHIVIHQKPLCKERGAQLFPDLTHHKKFHLMSRHETAKKAVSKKDEMMSIAY